MVKYKPIKKRWEEDEMFSSSFSVTPEEVLEFHLPGKHDQSSHGNEEPSNEENKANLVKLPETIERGIYANLEQRKNMKIKIMKDISRISGLDELTVRNFISDWAVNCSNTGELAAAVQTSVSEKFGSSISDFQKDKWANYNKDLIDSYRQKTDVFVDSVYKNTQEFFSRNGYKPDDEIELYRGIRYVSTNMKGKSRYEGNAIESWTSNVNIAKDPSFSGEDGVVMKTKVKVKDIFSTAITGQGCLTENEIIVFGDRVKEIEVLDDYEF